MENKDEAGMLHLLLGHTRSWSLQALQCEAPVLRNPPTQSYLQPCPVYPQTSGSTVAVTKRTRRHHPRLSEPSSRRLEQARGFRSSATPGWESPLSVFFQGSLGTTFLFAWHVALQKARLFPSSSSCFITVGCWEEADLLQ